MTNSGNHPPLEQLQDAGQAESPVMTSKPRILIVEDDTAVAMMMVYLLTQAGCETEVAATGKKAMQLAEGGNFDLITLDVDLPGISGFKICSRLKENLHLHDTPVVFVSGHPQEECRQQAVELGAADYITKPFDALDFASRILSHIKTGGELKLVEVTSGDSP
jgi:DNA-binding response OmpR family regulator